MRRHLRRCFHCKLQCICRMWYGHGVPPAATADALFGRDSELSRLVSWVNSVVGGKGNAVLIEGEPGVGKSALARSGCAVAAELGCQVFWGAGDELGQELPLLPLLDALRVREPSADERRTTIVRFLRGEFTSGRFTSGRGEDLAGALAEQLLALVDELCERSPVVLVVDDLQWADPATVALWARMARSVSQVPLLLVGMMRPVPQRDDLLALRNSVSITSRLRLHGLPNFAVAELVGALAGGKPCEELLRLADGAAGNPLYLTELVDALARSSCLTVTEAGVAELGDGSAPGSLSAAIADRLGFVPRWVRRVLRAAALLGVEFSVSDLAVVLGRGVAHLVPAMEEARAAGVLVESGEGLRFRHPMIRAALYEELPAPVRAAWHRDAGRALAEAGAPVDRVARQLLPALGGSLEPMDEWMLDWLAGAAPLLVGQAPRAAAELLRRAVTSSPADTATHDSLVCRLADALYRVGDLAEAEQVVRQALTDAADPAVVVDLHWTLAQCRIVTGRFAESLATLKQVLASPEISARHRARLLVLTARMHFNLGQVETAGQVATEALAQATDVGDNWAIAWALHVLIIVTGNQGQVADALPLFDRALTVTQADPTLTDLRLLLLVNQAVALGDLDRYESAFAAAREARRLAYRAGLVVRQAQAHNTLGQLLFNTGQWDEAIAEVEALAEDMKDPCAACCDHGIAAVIYFHRGEAGNARQHLAAAAPRAKRIGNRVIASLALGRSLDAEDSGTPAEALATLTAGFANNAEELEEMEDLLADAVRLAVNVGDERVASSLTGHAEALVGETEVPHRRANALYCRGLLDRDAARLLAAADQYRDAGRPLGRAKAFEAAAGILVDNGDRDQARAAFTDAVDVYASLGATRDVARLQARFRACGIRRGPHSKHRTARSGWESLTPTESRVAALVADGMSNPQIAAKLFLSRRTVATHVSHILGKLDVNSRIDIAREAGRRQPA
jgi:DNA-binding CsgD family transcriptional regulator